MLESLDISKYKRNPDKIKSYIKKSGNMLITSKDLHVIFPQKFVDKSLTILSSHSYVLGTFAILDNDGNYSVSLIPARLEIQPAEIETITIDDIEFVSLEIEAGTDLISNIQVIQDNSLAFDMFDLFFLQGKVPWYIEYMDLPILFNYLLKYAGSKAGKSILAYELLTAVIARQPEDPSKELRLIFKNIEDAYKLKPKYVGLENIWYAFKSTLSKVGGAYMKLGIVSSILRPEKEISDLEHIVRE